MTPSLLVCRNGTRVCSGYFRHICVSVDSQLSSSPLSCSTLVSNKSSPFLGDSRFLCGSLGKVCVFRVSPRRDDDPSDDHRSREVSGGGGCVGRQSRLEGFINDTNENACFLLQVMIPKSLAFVAGISIKDGMLILDCLRIMGNLLLLSGSLCFHAISGLRVRSDWLIRTK